MDNALLLFFSLKTQVNLLATSATVFLVLILTLLFIMAIAAGAEVGFFTLKAKDINFLKTKDEAGSVQAIRLLEQPERLVATLRVAKYVLSIGIIVVAYFFLSLFLPARMSTLVALLIYIGIILLGLLLFGEILPKVYARQNNVRLVLFSAPVIVVLQGVLRPFIGILMDSKRYKAEKMERQQHVESDSEEFSKTVEFSLGHSASQEEVDIFKGILKFGKITVKQIMLPRLDTFTIRESWSFQKVKQEMFSSGFSRIPVYKSSIDDIVGMIYSKDFLPYLDLEQFDWHSLIRPAYFVHQHKLIEDLFREFQQRRTHFAIVVDEFGGTSGIVTLEDVMEEIVGDIRDEFDAGELNYRQLSEDAFIFEGKILINDFCRILDLPFGYFDAVKGENDSLAGLVLEIAGRFPKINDNIAFDDFEFTVLSTEKLRISKLKVMRQKAATE